MWQRLALVLAAALALGLLVLNLLVWTGGIVTEPSSEPAPAKRAPAEPTGQPPAPRPAREQQPIAREKPTRPKATPGTALTISATRGDCWVEVRAGSSSGQILYAGTLATGSTIKFHREKIWLRLGAASNVDVVVNGRQSTVPPGTIELSLPT
jgi:hypothetical protein